MTNREMQMLFDSIVEQTDPDFQTVAKPDSYTIFNFLNLSQEQIVKARYEGTDGESFEQTQKRTDDLRILLTETDLATSAGGVGNKPNSYIATLPVNYFTTVGEEATISFIDEASNPHTIRTLVLDSDLNTYARSVEDPFSEHVLHYEKSKPLRLFYQTEVELISDGNYSVDTYHLRYLRLPHDLELDGSDCELPEHMHREIVKTAVSMFLSSVGQAAVEKQRLASQE